MFRITGDSVVFPQLYPMVERKLPTAKDKGWTKVGGFTLRDKTDFIPQPGLQENVCACEANEIHMCGAATMGKAQPYDAKVLTPSGFVNMGDINVGDKVITPFDKIANVIAIFPQGTKDVYELKLVDGRKCECCLEHLWTVYDKEIQVICSENEIKGSMTVNTDFLIRYISKGKSFYVPNPIIDDICFLGLPFCTKIKSIKKVRKAECQCILIDNDKHLYITDDFIVTHNTFTGILLWGYRANRKGASGAMISTRLQDSKKGSSIFRDNELVWGGYANCEYNTSDYPTFYWKKWGTAWRLIHSNFNTNNPVEWAAFVEYAKKNQNGYQYFDEANDLQEKQYHYWNSRNRDDSGVRPQSVYSYNPPGSNHYFTRNLMNGGYVGSDYYFKPEMNGVVRYYYSPTDNVDDRIWGDTPQEVALAANITLTEKDIAAGLTKMDMIRSFAAFTGEASDNRMLIASTGGKSVANLLYSGQGNVLKGGYFGDIESDEININRQMIHSLWENPLSEDENMYATMDISSGKTENDKAPMIIWRGLQGIALEFFSGSPKELEGWIDAMLKKWRVPVTNFAFDATGHGYWVQAFTDGIPITWNKRVMQEYDNNGNPIQTDEYFNLRSQLLGKTEVLIKSGQLSMAIPKDKVFIYGHKGQQRRFIDILFDEIDLFAITHKNKKIYYRSKDEFKDKYKFSPDITETISLRAVFELDARPKKQLKPVTESDAYDELYHRPPMRSAYGTFRRKIY